MLRSDSLTPTVVRVVDASLSVNDVLRRWPAAIAPLNALGIDTCCGGADSLTDAAAAAGVPVEQLTAAIAAVAA